MPLHASAILFDLDGVLADSTPSVIRAWSAWARRVGLDPEELLPKVHGRRAIETIRAARPDLDAEAELATLVADEATDNDDTHEIPGAGAFVRALPPVMITAESIERGKPNPECYLKGAEALGVRPEDCIVVEDAPIGAEAARAAGMRLVALTTTHRAEQLQPADLTVPDLTHLVVRVKERSNGANRVSSRMEIDLRD